MKKEFYRRKLPHYNTPGQEYYVTIILDSSVPKNSMKQNKLDIEIAKNNLDIAIRQKESDDVIQNYTNILKEFKTAYSRKIEKILHNQNNPEVDLSKSFNMKPIISTMQFWNDKRIENIAWSIMPNHIHWVFYLKERSIDNKEVYLQDILHSVKLFTAREINKNESRNGRLWSEESFDTTVRNENHLHNVIKYILYNPVKARLVKHWSEWAGNYINPKYLNEIEIEFGESDD